MKEIAIDPLLLVTEVATPGVVALEEDEEDELPTPPRSLKRKRLSTTLAPSSLLLSPSSTRPADGNFSPGQVLWASSMLSAVLDGKVMGDFEGADAQFLVDGVRRGALEVEVDHECTVGMDGFARNESLEKLDWLLERCLRKEEVIAEEVLEESKESEGGSESEVEADDEVKAETEEVLESDVEELGEFVSDEEEQPAVGEQSSSSDEVYSSEEDD